MADTEEGLSTALVLVDKEIKYNTENGTTDSAIPLDALPYIDIEYSDDTIKAQVDALVAAEMENSPLSPEDYLTRLNLPEPELKLVNTSFLDTEWRRVLERRSQTPFDGSRYSVEGPEDKTQINSWQKAIENAQAQLEHQTNRAVNLELVKRFGPHAWKLYNQHLTQMEKTYDNLMKSKKTETDQLNRRRKQEQVSAGEKLIALEEQFYTSVSKNYQIEAACQKLEAEIATLSQQVQDKGLTKPKPPSSASDEMDLDGQEFRKEDEEGEVKSSSSSSSATSASSKKTTTDPEAMNTEEDGEALEDSTGSSSTSSSSSSSKSGRKRKEQEPSSDSPPAQKNGKNEEEEEEGEIIPEEELNQDSRKKSKKMDEEVD